MAINNLESSGSSTNTNSYPSGSLNTNANSLLLACIVTTTASATTPTQSITDNFGMTWVLVSSVLHTNFSRISVYRTLTPRALTGLVITFSTTDTQARAAWSIVEITDVITLGTSGAGAVRQSAKSADGGTSTTPTATLGTLSHTTNPVIGFGFCSGNNTLATGSGFNQIGTSGLIESALRLVSEESTNDTGVDFTASGGNTAAIAVEINLKSTNPSSFNPLSIGWFSSYWTDGPRFKERAYAGGVGVPTFPDETNSRDASQTTASLMPTFVPRHPAFANSPALSFDSGDYMTTANFGSQAQPLTIFTVGAFTNESQGTSQAMYDGIVSTDRAALLPLTTATPDSWWIYGGTGTINGGVADTLPHAFFASYNGASSLLDVDGIRTAAGSAGTNALTGLTIGASYLTTSNFNGHLYFLGLLVGSLTEDERKNLLSWANYILSFDQGRAMPNNYQFIEVGDGMSASERIR